MFLHTYRVTRAQWCIFATEYENSAIPGTTLPEDLILIHERGEHYSLQASREMTLAGKNLHNCVHRKISPLVELNSEVTSFLNDEAIRMTKKEWHAKFPTRTD
ncbi:hypothetical protein LTS06_011249 [Exophiala xenobiotica]|nr:hypothetical protein LTS06_011249 [Exophiala xenobiotica]KAK5347914.1 hypothetical protein LTR61_008543 [Exophiala xenobiotica]